MRFVRGLCAVVSLLPVVLVAGCSVSFAPAASPATGSLQGLQGVVHGGQQPIVGAHIYVYAAGTAGYVSPSQSLLTAYTTGSYPTTADGNGNYYVTTDATGSFGLTGEYTCTAGEQVYLYSVGGNPGAGSNSAAGLMAVLGQCPAGGSFAASVPYVTMNEVSTVAAAYAMAGFAVDATDIADDENMQGNTTAALAKTGMANAFANAGQLVSLQYGQALTKTPVGSGTPPQYMINLLGNILAACVNSADTLNAGVVTHSTNCQSLFGLATKDSTSTGAQPTDTASAAINIAHYPGQNVATLCTLPSKTPPFSPVDGGTMNDLIVGIQYSGAGLGNLLEVAVDSSGNAWVTNAGGTAIVELSNVGKILSGSSGYTGGGLLTSAYLLALDSSNNVWLTNSSNSSVIELNSSGSVISGSGSAGYTGGGLYYPYGIAIDGSGNAWIANDGTGANSVTNLTSSGVPLSGPSGDVIGNLSRPYDVAVDNSGNVWITNNGNNTLTNYTMTGNLISATAVYSIGGRSVAIDGSGGVWVTGGYLTKLTVSGTSSSSTTFSYIGSNSGAGVDLAIDGAGNAWSIAGAGAGEVSNAGQILSPYPAGFSGGIANEGSSTIFNTAVGVAVDGSGDVWYANRGIYAISAPYGYVTEIIGSAVPVVTPLANGVKYEKLGTRP